MGTSRQRKNTGAASQLPGDCIEQEGPSKLGWPILSSRHPVLRPAWVCLNFQAKLHSKSSQAECRMGAKLLALSQFLETEPLQSTELRRLQQSKVKSVHTKKYPCEGLLSEGTSKPGSRPIQDKPLGARVSWVLGSHDHAPPPMCFEVPMA